MGLRVMWGGKVGGWEFGFWKMDKLEKFYRGVLVGLDWRIVVEMVEGFW